MRKNRACDSCAARKAKCDRQSPCRRCIELSISCITVRKESKSGPKGPWARKRYKVCAADHGKRGSGQDIGNLDTQSAKANVSPSVTLHPQTLRISSNIQVSILRHYLNIYQQELYPVWPVVSKDDLVSRLRDPDDVEAYALATAISAVTIAQLNLPPADNPGLPLIDGLVMTVESERARHKMNYQNNPSISVLLSSFFLHIASANQGKIHKATFLLREAITCAQILGLDKSSHFHSICKLKVQLHLRIIWLLFITERGHTTRFELPRTLRLSPGIPELEVDENPAILFAFVNMCKLFQNFGLAMDRGTRYRSQEFYTSMHRRLLETQEYSQSNSDIQRADFLVTQQWMRIVLWKSSLFDIKLSASPTDEGLSLCLPDEIARNVVLHLNTFPTRIIEAHGLGMEMKLFDVAISLADILLCNLTTPIDYQLMQVTPREVLSIFVQYLASFRGGDNVKMQALQQKLFDTASSISPILDHVQTNQEVQATDAEEG